MKQDDVQDEVLSTGTLFKTIKAEGLLVKPGFDEAGRCPERCPIHENTIQTHQGRGPAGETRFNKAGQCPIEM